jgi:hypothetical protein
MKDDFDLDGMLKDLQENMSGGLSQSAEIHEESLSSFSFLTLECKQGDIGRAMAIRNYWMHLCSR